MARTESTARAPQHIAGDSEELTSMADAVNYLDAYKAEVSENALIVARQVGYDGTITVGALEDEIRFYQRRSVEACIELGKRLLVLKELTPHGEFSQRAELLGFAPRMAQKFMAATLKFAKANSNSLLKASGTQSKLLELLILDDGEIEALESGETVRGVTLDKIETMSVSELKKALREANERMEAKDKVIADKTETINSQAEKLALAETKKQNDPPTSVEQRLLDARANLQATALHLKVDAASRLMRQTKELLLIDKGQEQFAAALIIDIKRELEIIVGDCGLPTVIDENPVPEWMRGTEFDPNQET